VPFPVIGNWLDESGQFHCVDGEIGLDKGKPIEWFANHGLGVVGFGGDGIGDMEGAKATRKLGGTVIAVGNDTSGYASEFHRVASYRVTDYRTIIPLIPEMIERARLASAKKGS
jgi:hypothetical protein